MLYRKIKCINCIFQKSLFYNDQWYDLYKHDKYFVLMSKDESNRSYLDDGDLPEELRKAIFEPTDISISPNSK